MKEEFQQKIDNYLMRRMSDEERMAFENEVDGNEELREQLSFTEEVLQVLKSRNNKLARMREWEKKAKHKEKNRSGRKIYLWISGIAAVLIVGIFTIYTYFSPDTKNPLADVYHPEYRIIDMLLAHNDFRYALERIEIEEEILLKQDWGETVDVDTVACDSACADDYDFYKPASESEKRTEAVHHEYKEPELDKHDDKITDNAIQTQASDELSTLESIVDPEKKEKLEHLYLLKAKALIGLKRVEEALSLLDKLRSFNNKYKSQADSLYKSLNK